MEDRQRGPFGGEEDQVAPVHGSEHRSRPASRSLGSNAGRLVNRLGSGQRSPGGMREMSRNGRPLNLEELGTGDTQKRIAAGADTVLVPIGSIERHGNPFTPLGLDGIIVRELVERAARKA